MLLISKLQIKAELSKISAVHHQYYTCLCTALMTLLLWKDYRRANMLEKEGRVDT